MSDKEPSSQFVEDYYWASQGVNTGNINSATVAGDAAYRNQTSNGASGSGLSGLIYGGGPLLAGYMTYVSTHDVIASILVGGGVGVGLIALITALRAFLRTRAGQVISSVITICLVGTLVVVGGHLVLDKFGPEGLEKYVMGLAGYGFLIFLFRTNFGRKFFKILMILLVLIGVWFVISKYFGL